MKPIQTVVINIAVIFGLFFRNIDCVHFEFGNWQEPCILLDMDSTFKLSMGSQIAEPFTLDGANTTASQSLCGSETRSALLSLSLFPTNEQLRITFQKEASSQRVSMSVVLVLDPVKHFENASQIDPFELDDGGDLPVGTTNMSYRCNSQQEMFFNQDPGFSMFMKITNLHVQAYDIDNGIFSPAIECDIDSVTTSQTTIHSFAPTTEEQTTVSTKVTTPIENKTTPKTPITFVRETTSQETNATYSQPETTTSEPAPTTTPRVIIPKYKVEDGSTVCVVVQGYIKFNINYERNDSQTESAVIFLPEDANVSGQCRYEGSNTTQELKVSFNDDTWSVIFLISVEVETLLKGSDSLQRGPKDEPSYSWKRVEFTYVVDKNFPDPKESDIGQKKNVKKEEEKGVFKAIIDGSYRCNLGETLELQDGVSMDFGNFQYKAFGTDNSGNFPDNNVSVCPADKNNDMVNSNDNIKIIVVLISVFGSIIVITGIVITVWRCKKNKKASGQLRSRLLSNQTHENYKSNAASILKGSDECRDTVIKRKTTHQSARMIESSSSGTREIDQVSGRQNQPCPQDSNSDRGNIFDII